MWHNLPPGWSTSRSEEPCERWRPRQNPLASHCRLHAIDSGWVITNKWNMESQESRLRLPLWICVCFALVHWSLQHLFCGRVVSCCWKTCLTAPASLPMGNLGVRMDGVNKCDGRAWVCSSFLFGCHDSKRFANFPYQFDENHLFCKYLQDMCNYQGSIWFDVWTWIRKCKWRMVCRALFSTLPNGSFWRLWQHWSSLRFWAE